MNDLQQKISQLEAKNLELRLRLKVGKEAESQVRTDQSKKIDEMVANLSSEKELSRIIDEYKEKYSDYGRDRRSALDWHVSQIKRLLLPTTTTQFSLWILDQPDEFYDVDMDKCFPARPGSDISSPRSSNEAGEGSAMQAEATTTGGMGGMGGMSAGGAPMRGERSISTEASLAGFAAAFPDQAAAAFPALGGLSADQNDRESDQIAPGNPHVETSNEIEENMGSISPLQVGAGAGAGAGVGVGVAHDLLDLIRGLDHQENECECACERACERECECACACAWEHACERECACAWACVGFLTSYARTPIVTPTLNPHSPDEPLRGGTRALRKGRPPAATRP
mmetsp:Transcript_100453/g.287570  ORF Transcript_100453/g.287570 Transcript_100453/m.287570 type:complete len:341 (-) Transcript_100453:358-1380(-)